MSHGTQRPTAPRPVAVCLRCGGELPNGAGYYHLQIEKCLEGLSARIRELERAVFPGRSQRERQT